MHAFTLLTLPLLATAHFHMHFPAPRGEDDEEQASFPCGGYAQTQNRTLVPLTSVGIALELGHTENLLTVALALGNDVGSSFNTIILSTIQEYGPGDFCWASIGLPADLGIVEGMNGTIQVITNSHDGSGLYNCADVTFTTTNPLTPSSCTNGTGISATPLAAASYVFANESASHSESSSSSASATASETGSASATASEAAASATESGSGADTLAANVGWGVLGAAVLGGVALM